MNSMTMNINKGDKLVAKKQLNILGSVAANVGDVFEVKLINGSYVKLEDEDVILSIDNSTLMEHFQKHVEKNDTNKVDDVKFEIPNANSFDELIEAVQKNENFANLIKSMSADYAVSKDNVKTDVEPEGIEGREGEIVIPNKVTKEDVMEIIDNSNVIVENGVFDKSTVLHCQLPNGFVITTTSACVDPENYDPEIGEDICYDKLMEKIWELEGYRLQNERYEMEQLENWMNCGEATEDDLDCENCPYSQECFGDEEEQGV